MSNIIVSTKVSKLTLLELSQKAHRIHSGLISTPQMAGVSPTPADFLLAINALDASIAQIQDLERQLSAAREVAALKSANVKEYLTQVGAYVQGVARNHNDSSLVMSAGFELRHAKSSTTLPVPDDVRLSEIAKTSGKLLLRFDGSKTAKSYGIFWCYGESPENPPAQALKIVSSTRNVVLDLESGERVWVRVKAYGSSNTESDWSDVAVRIVP